MAYTAGRGWIEMLRVDTVNHVFGLRLNVWTSLVLFVLATVYFVAVGRRRPGREDPATVESAGRRGAGGGSVDDDTDDPTADLGADDLGGSGDLGQPEREGA
jgi:hypothetical protein